MLIGVLGATNVVFLLMNLERMLLIVQILELVLQRKLRNNLINPYIFLIVCNTKFMAGICQL